jgi:hypothetical protein
MEMYTGAACATPNCFNGVLRNGSCSCNAGWIGANCRQKDCSGHGIAKGAACACDEGFSGPTCNVRTCDDNCSSHGVCVEGKCVCDTGYSGDTCAKAMKAKPHRCSVFCVHTCLRKCEGTFANKELPAYRGCFNNCTNGCFGNCMSETDFWYTSSLAAERSHPDKVPIPQTWVDDMHAKHSGNVQKKED